MAEKLVGVGVLSLQGDVDEHLRALEACHAEAIAVKTPAELDRVRGLIIPGGESTTVGTLLERFGIAKPLRKRVNSGMPVWGTCMGMIVLASRVVDSKQPTLGLMSIEVRRNAFGRQIVSAELPVEIEGLSGRPFPGVFIRAPWIEKSWDDVRVLASIDGKGVMARQGNLLGTAFHPELSGDLRLHKYFLDMVTAAAH